MELWNIDTRSLPYTILQLLRPGYLISDYISGRRQAFLASIFEIATILHEIIPTAFWCFALYRLSMR